MAELSWPFENQDTTETEYSELFKRLQNDGVAGDPTNTLLKATGDSTGMNVKVAAGFAIVRGHIYHNTAQLTLTVTTAAAQPRIDLVVLELDPTGNVILAKMVDGTAAATPVAPTLTQTNDGIYELEIGRVAVAANATTISAANVSDTRPFTGSQWGVWTTATRPTASRIGQAGYNTTLAQPEFWNGTAWTVFTPTEISASIITSGTLSMDRIASEAIGAAKLATNSVTEPKIASNAVIAGKIASNAVTNAKIQDGAITSGKIEDGAVITAKIPDSGITTAKINADAVTTVKIASSAVTEAKIASNAVTTVKVNNGAITTAKLDSAASVDFVTAKRVFIQQATPSTSGRTTGDVWISW